MKNFNPILGAFILVVAVVAILIAIGAYERTGGDIAEEARSTYENAAQQAEEGAQEIQEDARMLGEEIEETSNLVIAVTALQVVRNDLQDNSVDEDTYQSLARAKDNIGNSLDMNNSASQESLLEIQNTIDEIEQMLRANNYAQAQTEIEGLITRLEEIYQEEVNTNE